jgi:hypothetical protein
VDTLVESFRRKRWTTARFELASDSSAPWLYTESVDREDGRHEPDASFPDSVLARGLTPTEQGEVARVLREVALLRLIEYAATDSTDSTVAVIRLRVKARLVPGDSSSATVLAAAGDWGSMIVGDLVAGRFVPRWETWGYDTNAEPDLVDLDGDGINEFVFTTQSHDAKGHVTGQLLWVFDRAGRELTRQATSDAWDASQANPLQTDVTDSEYCDVDCGGGFVIGRPGPDGRRPIVVGTQGSWVLNGGRYVFQPAPPLKAKAKRPARAPKRATKKAQR